MSNRTNLIPASKFYFLNVLFVRFWSWRDRFGKASRSESRSSSLLKLVTIECLRWIVCSCTSRPSMKSLKANLSGVFAPLARRRKQPWCFLPRSLIGMMKSMNSPDSDASSCTVKPACSKRYKVKRTIRKLNQIKSNNFI